MVEEKKDPVQVLRNRRKASGIAVWAFIVIGFAIMVAGITWANGVSTFVDEKHLTTPDIPLKDAENATYSFTAKEANDLAESMFVVFFATTIVFVAIGYTILVMNPRERELHKIHCKILDYGPVKFCHECGMNMKKMDKYKDE